MMCTVSPSSTRSLISPSTASCPSR
jgi:hypothetical protein